MSNLKEQILGADDHKLEALEVPEWKATVFLRTWSLSERNKVRSLYMLAKDKMTPESIDKAYGTAIIFTLADQDGNRLFTEKDLPKLLEKQAALLEGLADKCLDFNAMKDSSVEKKDS